MNLLASEEQGTVDDLISEEGASLAKIRESGERKKLHKKYSRLMEFVKDYRNSSESRSGKFRDPRGQDKRPLRLRKLSLEVILKS